MAWTEILLTIMGLCLFETICSIDNAIINAEVLGTMQEKARRWFLLWGFLFAVFMVRGLLPWLIVWVVSPSLGPWGALTATFSNDPSVKAAIESSAPVLTMGGGIFLIFLALHWLFLEPKNFGLWGEERIMEHGLWFYAIVSIILTVTVWLTIHISPSVAFGAVVGSSVFFITHGFKQNAEESERKLIENPSSAMSDISKILYLEVIDATFSIDGVLGAFAFTMSVPLILVGNALGAYLVRQITISNVDRIKKYAYLKNGAMYSILFLGMIMMADGFGMHIPSYLSPLLTFAVVGYFFAKSVRNPPPVSAGD